jgi:nucleoid-associated protein YgaU
MTSDAKIGLLLGLVFIFIIAFVINGMPRFRNARESKELVAARDFVQDDPIGARERSAGVIEEPLIEEYPEQPSREENKDTENIGGYKAPWNDENSYAQAGHANQSYYSPAYYTDEQTSDYVAQDYNTETKQLTETSENNQDRYNMPFPFNISNTREVPLDNSANRNNAPGVQPASQNNQINLPKPYVVQEGDDNLSKIAKKFYGQEEGNRWVNVKKIYERNRDVLKSLDKVFVGQKIVIPPPEPPLQNKQPADVLRGPMFETVPSVGGSRQSTTANNQDVIRWYTVKENDNLWKIADKELGEASRFNEISKLNANILTNENELKPGMKLRLPDK